MENILIVLVLIGSLIYKVYSNYKEEMEKAAKRKQQTPSVPPPVQTQQQVPAPAPPAVPTRTPQPPKRIAPVVRFDDIPSEVKSVQQRKSELTYKKVEILEEKKETEKEAFEFDLRQAVIQSAILERPYK